MIAQLNTDEAEEDGFNDLEDQMDDEGEDVMDKNADNLDNNDILNNTTLSLKIGLQYSGKNYEINCEGSIIDDVDAEASEVEDEIESQEAGEFDSSENEIDDDIYSSKNQAFGPVSIRCCACNETISAENNGHTCLYPDDLSEQQNQKLEDILEEIGITNESVNQIVDMLIKHEGNLVEEQKKDISKLLGE